MARIRTIKPDFFTSEDIVALSPNARLLYIALWCESDRDGRMKWRPGTFKIRYLPGDDVDVESLCHELLDAGLVVQYGDGLAYIPTFGAHQHVNPREKDSTFPDPHASPTPGGRVSDASSPVLASSLTHREEGKEKEGKQEPTEPTREPGAPPAGKHDDPSAEFLKAWSEYPKREGGNSRAEAWKAWRARVRNGASEEDLIEGTRRYATYCQAKGIVGTPFVKQAATFFGSGEHWREEWKVDPTAKVGSAFAQDPKPNLLSGYDADAHQRARNACQGGL